MEYLIYLSNYLLVGILVMFLINGIHNKVIKIKGGNPFTEVDKVILTLLWPLYFTTFVYNFIKGWVNRSKQ